ncbi:hypothetical protein CMQ_444 [Grosmannia clavigera kw1407]|uniref:Uncharacterized protein n=1 Tax=Grosmannia clavigera (strain kw1407 / UAMH 11150) TaxID=655863 RepID=F0XBX1_GROCL|nr:uncharacterized protein CMQ_444 [Grosmannia clavigera kw1407]EFX03516.1 hypothetical protein CMQ_444 [Grosmannia clavigera kw1407]
MVAVALSHLTSESLRPNTSVIMLYEYGIRARSMPFGADVKVKARDSDREKACAMRQGQSVF